MRPRTTAPRLSAGVALAAVLTTVLAACGGSDGSGESSAGGTTTIRAAQILAPPSFDPALITVGPAYNYSAAAYENLVNVETDGTLVPGIATEWEYTSATQLVLKLRTDVEFTDGTTLDAALVAANIERYKATPGPPQARMKSIETVTVTDDSTVTLDLNTADLSLPQAFSESAGMMVSQAAIDDPSMLTDAPAGSGPWVYAPDESTPGSEYVYEASETYTGPVEVGFDRIEFVVIADNTAALNALLAGDVDVASAQYSQAETAKSRGMAGTSRLALVSGLWLFDREGAVVPAMADVRVRQAINYAIDREAVANALWSKYQQTTDQIYGPDSSGFDADLDETYPYDPEKAEELLAEAGYEDGFTLPIVTRQTYNDAARTEAIAPYLDAVGIKVEIVDRTNDFEAAVAGDEFAAAQGQARSLQSYVTATQFLLPTGQYNPFESSDPELDALFTTAANELDETKSAEDWQAVSTWLVDNAWFAPIAFFNSDTIYNPEVLDVEMTVGFPVSLPSEWKPAEG
jgi:peptide/nickel transport system substrate-binding protein